MSEDERMLDYIGSGASASDIANWMLIPIGEVRERLTELGVDLNSRSRSISIWEMDEADRRAAIIKRAARGARKALNA